MKLKHIKEEKKLSTNQKTNELTEPRGTKKKFQKLPRWGKDATL